MSIVIRCMPVLAGVLLLAGCGGKYVGLWETEQNHLVGGTITAEEVRDSILEAARNTGWKARELSEFRIEATKKIRVHTITLNIPYTDRQYMTRYGSSIGMKIQCSTYDVQKKKHQVSGLEDCPGDRPPINIHSAYKVWVDELVAEIERLLASKN
jgi:hypothetical protein